MADFGHPTAWRGRTPSKGHYDWPLHHGTTIPANRRALK
ncbi:hypothetical protein BN903_193 [Halorubrum sp. AJ67]|nr:hypothetical protein BN903_193 [Halorubrum sp. AJ67]